MMISTSIQKTYLDELFVRFHWPTRRSLPPFPTSFPTFPPKNWQKTTNFFSSENPNGKNALFLKSPAFHFALIRKGLSNSKLSWAAEDKDGVRNFKRYQWAARNLAKTLKMHTPHPCRHLEIFRNRYTTLESTKFQKEKRKREREKDQRKVCWKCPLSFSFTIQRNWSQRNNLWKILRMER